MLTFILHSTLGVDSTVTAVQLSSILQSPLCTDCQRQHWLQGCTSTLEILYKRNDPENLLTLTLGTRRRTVGFPVRHSPYWHVQEAIGCALQPILTLV